MIKSKLVLIITKECSGGHGGNSKTIFCLKRKKKKYFKCSTITGYLGLVETFEHVINYSCPSIPIHAVPLSIVKIVALKGGWWNRSPAAMCLRPQSVAISEGRLRLV